MDDARDDGIDENVVSGEITRKRFDQIENSGVVQSDRHRRRLRLAGRAAKYIDDAPPAALAHQRCRKANATRRAVELVVEQAVPLRRIQRKEVASPDHGGAIHEDIDAVELLRCELKYRAHRSLVVEIG